MLSSERRCEFGRELRRSTTLDDAGNEGDSALDFKGDLLGGGLASCGKTSPG